MTLFRNGQPKRPGRSRFGQRAKHGDIDKSQTKHIFSSGLGQGVVSNVARWIIDGCQIRDRQGHHVVIRRIEIALSSIGVGGKTTPARWCRYELQPTVWIDPNRRGLFAVKRKWKAQW